MLKKKNYLDENLLFQEDYWEDSNHPYGLNTGRSTLPTSNETRTTLLSNSRKRCFTGRDKSPISFHRTDVGSSSSHLPFSIANRFSFTRIYPFLALPSRVKVTIEQISSSCNVNKLTNPSVFLLGTSKKESVVFFKSVGRLFASILKFALDILEKTNKMNLRTC